ncbi:MAG TPA: DNA polymerase III subunit delta [Sphingomicrobium sp.]|nr:DNA polymerase III subunit delta [Sphingomicrobium sp.]
MRATKGTIGRSVDQPNPNIRFYLFHGPDEAQSRALASRLLEALGAAKYVVSGGAIKSDPAVLVDEASALSLFGGKRLIWIEPAGKEIEAGLMALLEVPSLESAVVAITGTLTKTSTLLKVSESSPMAISYASYVPEGQEAERMVIDLGRRFGLKIRPPLAARLAAAADNDQAVVGQELEKLALYVDASPHAPKELDDAAIDAVGADSSEGNFQRLADLALGGDIEGLAEELTKLTSGGSEAIPVVRSLQRRLLFLAPARARIERGETLESVLTSFGRTLFWKDKAAVTSMLQKWSADELATAADRTSKLERALMFTSAPEYEALGEELFAIARKARSR